MKPNRNPHRRWDFPVGLIAFLIFGCVYGIFAAYSLLVPQPGAPGLRQICIGFVAIAVIASYIQYLDFFFRRVRPFLAAWLGRQFGVTIKERVGLHGGGWDTKGGNLGTTLLIYLIDAAILITAVIGPIALIGIPTFLLAELFSSP
jgi:hypothetical protein